ncbi:hypothetical protein RND81_02G120000 [Saponaria officinalis]|uniref:Uncharacterized protein n=1 Tax=Saponaria officinalis TaxID=3572 RepID=A0AAW1MTG7_SAPOF
MASNSGAQEDIKNRQRAMYFSTLPGLLEDPSLKQLAEQLQKSGMAEPFGSALKQQNSSMSRVLDNLVDPPLKEQLLERLSRIRDDPTLKCIVDDLETEVHTAIMRLFLVMDSKAYQRELLKTDEEKKKWREELEKLAAEREKLAAIQQKWMEEAWKRIWEQYDENKKRKLLALAKQLFSDMYQQS